MLRKLEEGASDNLGRKIQSLGSLARRNGWASHPGPGAYFVKSQGEEDALRHCLRQRDMLLLGVKSSFLIPQAWLHPALA